MAQGLDWNALEETSSQVEADVKTGGGGRFSYSHLVEDWTIDKDKEGQPFTVDFRILPPTENMENMYFIRIVRYKFGKRQLISKAVYGEHCVLDELWQEYKARDKEPDIKALFDNFKNCSKQVLYLVPVLIFTDTTDGYAPDDDQSKILFFKAANFNDLHSIVVNPKYRVKDKVWGVIGREHGRNFTLGKGGKLITPDPDSLDFSHEYYDDYYTGDKRKDIWEYIAAAQKSDAHLESAIRNYFEGTPIIEDDGSTRKYYLDALGNVEEETQPEEAGEETEPEQPEEPKAPIQKPTGAAAPPPKKAGAPTAQKPVPGGVKAGAPPKKAGAPPARQTVEGASKSFAAKPGGGTAAGSKAKEMSEDDLLALMNPNGAMD